MNCRGHCPIKSLSLAIGAHCQIVIGPNSVLGHEEVGSGLGLSIVQTIAKRVGATIRLEHANTDQKTRLCVIVSF